MVRTKERTTEVKDKDPASDPISETAAGEATPSAGPATVESESDEMVLTYNRNTGEIICIEKADPFGGRQELAHEEYAHFFGHDVTGSEESMTDTSDGTEDFAVAHQQIGFEHGYYHGLAEYEAAVTAQAAADSSADGELDAAYHQGMADYEAALTAQLQDQHVAVASAYYQGMADYEAALTGAQPSLSSEDLAYYQGLADAEAAYAGLG